MDLVLENHAVLQYNKLSEEREVSVMHALAPQQLDSVMNAFVTECKNLFGEKLSDVLLFGSYARGDYHEESDIDVMILLDMSTEEVGKQFDGICKIASDIDLAHNVNLIPMLRSKNDYEYRKVFGFYRNVDAEGVSQYAR